MNRKPGLKPGEIRFEGMDFYPSEFSPEARDRIEKEKILAYRELLPRSIYDFNEQALAVRCIVRIFLAFAKEACALRKERGWTIGSIESKSKEFLRRLAIMVVDDKFPGLHRHWISSWNGSIAPDVERRFKESAEWKEYEDLLLAAPASLPEGDKSTVSQRHEVQVPTSQSADQDLRDAIRKKKERIAEIDGTPRRPQAEASYPRLEEDRENLVVEVEELETELREASVDRAMASWMRMQSSGMPDGSREANHPMLDAQKSRRLLGIELSDLENLRREVWMRFFDEASLPRAVELEWETVLRSPKMPDSDVHLGLTFALTREYVKAISRASAQLADLLVSAALSNISHEHFREAIWRECVDFVFELGRWEPFTTWADKVVRVSWQPPVTGDGVLERDRQEEATKKNREFFEKKIGSYGQDWLSAIDRAIELRRTISLPQVVADGEEKRMAMASESLASTKATAVPGLRGRQERKVSVLIPANWADLSNRKSISQKEAAELLECHTRTIRRLVTNKELNRSPKGRIVCDERLRKQIRDVHGAHVLR